MLGWRGKDEGRESGVSGAGLEWVGARQTPVRALGGATPRAGVALWS